MNSKSLGITGAVLVASLVATGATHRALGGWAVVKVQQVPDAWVTGRPLELSWDVRQHGVTKLDDLHPTIEARSGSRRVTGTAWAVEENGARGYRGRITFPERGDWQVTINSGFGRSRAVLVPWRVVDPGTMTHATVSAQLVALGVQPLAEAERGRRAFAALGCVTCHSHREVGVTGEVGDVGPDLTERRLAADYLARFLADPSIRTAAANGRRMPNLELRQEQIAPLVAFLAAGRRVTTR